ncbi:MAG: hypothetical protein SF182_22985 [Deltaproteobacteria bacterium]|nr:hypothetical protein [Deltaproteobacteria bacterium]
MRSRSRQAGIWISVLAVIVYGVASSAPAAHGGETACVGDCNGDGEVTVNEIITGVNIALGNTPVQTCPAFDRNGDGRVDISELIAGVANLLYGCGVTPPTSIPTDTPTGGASPSPTPPATLTATPIPAGTDTASPTPTRTLKPTVTVTRTPTTTLSVCGGVVTTLPVLCNLTVVPNPVSRSGTIAFRFGISDLNGDVNRLCIELRYPGLEPQVSCSAVAPTNRVINSIQMTTPVSASPLQFGTYQVGMQASDRAGNSSNVITATFTVQTPG